MTHHSELLNFIISLVGAKNYLEIGTFNRDHNYNKILCAAKCCVDPDPNAAADYVGSSDEYFKLFFELNSTAMYPSLYDVIFIDGLHHADQVRKDIINSWNALREGGFIVLHDSNPHSERITHVPRDSREWTGDVYKAVCQVQNPKITFDFDYGCCVIRKKGELKLSDDLVDWETFAANREKLLTLVPVQSGLKLIEYWVAND